jgi:hypothetical protein
MPFYLFKSASDDLMRALTIRPDSAVLPHVFEPWISYGGSEGLMEHVAAVSDEIQAALDARGYYLIQLERFEPPGEGAQDRSKARGERPRDKKTAPRSGGQIEGAQGGAGG